MEKEMLFNGSVFDTMDYVVQEIKTEICNDNNRTKIDSLIQVFQDLTKLTDDDCVYLTVVGECEYKFFKVGE